MKAKGVIKQAWNEKLQKKDGSGEYTKFFVILEGDEKKYNGFGTEPEGYEVGKEVEFEFEEVNGYYNIQQKRKGGYKGMGEIIKALTMPKVTIGYDRTVQVNQYEPKKVSCYVTQTIETIDKEKIDELIKIAKTSVEEELKQTITKPEKSGSAIEKVFKKDVI